MNVSQHLFTLIEIGRFPKMLGFFVSEEEKSVTGDLERDGERTCIWCPEGR